MPSLKDIRKRIGSIKNTQKITQAFKMVAAATLRRSEDLLKTQREELRQLAQGIMAGATKIRDCYGEAVAHVPVSGSGPPDDVPPPSGTMYCQHADIASAGSVIGISTKIANY